MKVLRRLDDAAPLIRSRTPFRNTIRRGERPSFSGAAHVPRQHFYFGNLPARYYDSARVASFHIFSYSTPIAWFAIIPHDMADLDAVLAVLDDEGGEWVMPNVKYSITTTSHQSLVSAALGGYHHSWGYGTYDCDTQTYTEPPGRPPALPVYEPSHGLKVPCGGPRW